MLPARGNCITCKAARLSSAPPQNSSPHTCYRRNMILDMLTCGPLVSRKHVDASKRPELSSDWVWLPGEASGLTSCNASDFGPLLASNARHALSLYAYTPQNRTTLYDACLTPRGYSCHQSSRLISREALNRDTPQRQGEGEFCRGCQRRATLIDSEHLAL